jgi:hypothetical protein
MPPFETERQSDDRGVVVAGGRPIPLPPGPCASPRWPSRSSDGTAPAPALPRGRTDIVQTLGSWLPYRALTAALVERATSSRGIRPAVRSETATFAAARSGRRSPLHRPRHAQARAGLATERPLPRTSPHASVPRSHPRNPVPPSWFCTTSMVSSARRSRACCIPLPVLGFAAFQGARFPIPDLANQIRAGGPTPSSRRTLTPPEEIPDCSRTTSPWPLPPCRWLPVPLGSSDVAVASTTLRAPPDRSLDFEAFLRCRVWKLPDRCRSHSPLFFHGLCSPSRSLPRPDGTLAIDPWCRRRRKSEENRASSNKLRSAPAASVGGRPVHTLLAEGGLGGGTTTRIRRSRSGHLTPGTDAVPKNNTGRETPAPPEGGRRLASMPSPVREDERGRFTEAVGIPSRVHRGTVGNRSSRA